MRSSFFPEQRLGSQCSKSHIPSGIGILLLTRTINSVMFFFFLVISREQAAIKKICSRSPCLSSNIPSDTSSRSRSRAFSAPASLQVQEDREWNKQHPPSLVSFRFRYQNGVRNTIRFRVHVAILFCVSYLSLRWWFALPPRPPLLPPRPLPRPPPCPCPCPCPRPALSPLPMVMLRSGCKEEHSKLPRDKDQMISRHCLLFKALFF